MALCWGGWLLITTITFILAAKKKKVYPVGQVEKVFLRS
jgi:hypothetical protein